MGCGSCSAGGCGSSNTKGCGSKGCATGGCNKLNTYDWFSGIAMPSEPKSENIYEVRFKNTHKDFFRNVNELSLVTGDMVVVESDRGYNVGQISLSGVLARLQMRKKKVKDHPERIRKIYRRATDEDLEKLKTSRSREYPTLLRSRVIVEELRLDMKVSDVEFQGDNAKAIFYYIADHRVDFRQLIKRLADEFRIRVEMRQIGLRYESGLVGGIGSCGRELCCSTWLTDFKSVPTSAARYQNLALNPMKISGQCGRLKCCLNYELETYLDALEDIPEVFRIETKMGTGMLQKTDIFKRVMWFSYENETTWIPIEVNRVKEMFDMNRRNIQPESLHHGESADLSRKEKSMDFVDVVGQSRVRPEPQRGKKKKYRGGQGQNRSESPSRDQERGSGGTGQNRNRNRPNRGAGGPSNRRPPRNENPRG